MNKRSCIPKTGEESVVSSREFMEMCIRDSCYSLEGRVLRDSTTHNIYDMENDFFPEQAMEIQIN